MAKKYRWILLNLAGIILVWVLTVVFTQNGLKSKTDHGETVEVPELTTYSIFEVEKILKRNNLRYKVIDSTTFYHTRPKGSVLKQFPKAGSKVKRNRELLLTINPFGEEKIPLPDLKDISVRQAIQQLNRSGFRIGKMRMADDLAENVVLWCEYRGDSLSSGDMLKKRSKIDLVIGNGFNSNRIALPDFIGRSYRDAMYTAAVNVLNPIGLRFDASVRDTLSSFVYKQYPHKGITRFIGKGESIELWFTQDQNKLNGEALVEGN